MQIENQTNVSDALPISGLFENYFLDYASYVILERAVPQIDDGLKPVQRRILHAMFQMNDGRYHKVANVIGQTMQYHPHGDAAIEDALVNLGQKELLIDTQGNWGDNRTGDRAAAARYIEARLTKFALEVAFHSQTTKWQLSYDGRKKEPVAFPMKFPLVLAQGVEGIAVGLSTKILPHNFCELINASIDILKGNSPEIFPDFPNGGMIDVSQYNGGKRGGKIRCRSHIEVINKNLLHIKTVPYGTTTSGVIDSIVKANDKGKIKIRKVVDNTARDIEIAVEIPNGVSPDVTISALYAFTDCEVSISPNACIIREDTPFFLSVNEILRYSTQHTKAILKWELEILRKDLMEKLLFASLEQIFIENRIYRQIEECETWKAVLKTIDQGLEPFKPQFYREITQDDLVRLTEIKIKRISKYDSFKADDLIKKLNNEIERVNKHLENITKYTITYFRNLLKKYGKGRERKTEIKPFDTIQISNVAIANQKLYVNRKEGFIGYGLKKDEYIQDCSDLDDIIVFHRNGKYSVSRIQEKAFVGKDIIHVAVWKKGDSRKVYHAVYRDPKSGNNYIKRFNVTAITRDREYDLTKGSKGSRVLYFSCNPNSESEIITVYLSQGAKAKQKVFDFDLGKISIKGRAAQGNIISKYSIRKITRKSIGASTLGGRKVWLDESVGRLNINKRGRFLGEFDTNNRILVLYEDGSYELTDFELTNRYDMGKILSIEKLTPKTVISAIHFIYEKKTYYIKRFQIETSSLNKRFSYIDAHDKSLLKFVSLHPNPEIEYLAAEGRSRKNREWVKVKLNDLIPIKGWKALGNRFETRRIVEIKDISAPLATQIDENAQKEGGDKQLKLLI